MSTPIYDPRYQAPETRPAPARWQPTKRARRFHWDRVPLAVLGFFILGLWWLAGGKWTIDGTPLLINAIFDFFKVPAELPPVSHWLVYILLCWLPILISIAEHRYAPWRGLRRWSILVVPFIVGIWLIVMAADWSSTWMAVTHPEPGAWLIAEQVAAITPLAAAWVTLTTFIPEMGFAVLVGWLWE
jgi:hypothetical protein